jgi:nucleotide-binding universal stress UspA family protein
LRAHVAAAGLPPSASVTCHVSHGPAVRGLLQAAEGADLLVVGAREEGGFAGLLLGSVGDQCVKRVVPGGGRPQGNRHGAQLAGVDADES